MECSSVLLPVGLPVLFTNLSTLKTCLELFGQLSAGPAITGENLQRALATRGNHG
jgi:hypothetical protein